MLYLRRWTALFTVGLLGSALLVNSSVGQGKKGVQPQPPPGSTGTAAGNSSVKIIEDARFRQIINIGRDCIKDGEWKQAIEALDAVLKEEKDHFVQVHENDPFDPRREISRWTSVKFEANNLLGSMKIEGLEVYEQTLGAEAKTKLDEAKQNGDRELVAYIAQRYCHTKAGVEANEILATLYLARGQVFPAALRFEKIMQMNPDWAKLNDVTLFKATVAFRRAGDTKNHEETWKRLQASLGPKQNILKVGEDQIPMGKLEQVINETPIIDTISIPDWPIERGNASRTAQAIGSPPLLDAPLWKRPLFKDKLDGTNDEDNDDAALTRVNAALKRVNDANIAALPGGFPIASQGIMVYRRPRDVCAVALKPMEIRTPEGEVFKIKPGEILWRSIAQNRSLAMLLEKPQYRAKLDPWLDSYAKLPGFDSFLYDNTLLGSIATDHRFVYAINDLGVPPHPNLFQVNVNNPQMMIFNAQELKPFLMQNELFAYDLVNGKLQWDLNAEDKDFKDSHFISPPISVGGKLYVLNERIIDPNASVPNPFGGMSPSFGGESEIRLVCIDPQKIHMVNNNPKPTIVEPIQVLGNILLHNRFVQDIPRRVNAVHLAYGEGVLVCPTHAGEVFGIDLMTRSLVWSYPYRETPHMMIGPPIAQFNQFQPRPKGGPNQTTTIVSKWKSAPPAIQDGKIVFTAPDADSVHCLNLRDGKPLWKRGQQKGDLYMAGVYNGRVLIVGDNKIRALDLKDGSRLWEIITNDLPSGQGVASKGIYYLPLKKGEILAIDIAKGEVKAHNRAATQGMAPGNLVFYEGMVLSQTTTEVMAYPQLTARLDIAKRESAADPENLTKMTEYGDLLLKDGQVHLAVETLLKVHDRKAPEALAKRVAERLFEALTDLMHIDFDKASTQYLKVYEDLTKVPGNDTESQQRQAKFFRLVGQGRESQGNLVEAFKMYKNFGALPIYRDVGIPSPEDPLQKIPINVWLRGRISGMLARAKEHEKKPLEAKIAEEWKEVMAKNDEGAIRSFVGMFDVAFKVGREARVRLAESIMERNDRKSFLEAELYLYQVTSSEHRTEADTGGRALAALAQLEEKKGTVDSMRLAAAYYRQLATEFTSTPVRNEKTGADLKNELATDKRFLPFLQDTKSTWGPVKMASRDIAAGSFPIGVPGFILQPTGDQTPFALQHRLMFNPADVFNPRIKLKDITTGEDRWETALGRVDMNQQLYFYLYQQANVNQQYHPNARYRFYQVRGHLIVCQIGVMVYGIDGDTGKELWKVQTVENLQPGVGLNQVVTDSEGNPEFIYYNGNTNQTFRVTLGRIGSAQASHVAVLGYKGLEVLDPLRGTLMWKKSDLPINSHIFGDDQYLFIVEVNDNGALGAARTVRASDGETQVAVADFSNTYQARVRLYGRQILAAHANAKGYTVRLYDILGGKDVWTKEFPAGSTVLQSEDPSITGIVEPNGKTTILDARTGKELLSSNLAQYRIAPQDLTGLQAPLLLQDSERYYIALNKPIDANKIVNGHVHNNFNNGTRCLPVNGWFVALHKEDGKRKIGERDVSWKKGDMAWHSQTPIKNQMLIVEQFDHLPVILFTTRYNEVIPNLGGNRWMSVTQSLQKANGMWAYDRSTNSNGSPWFSALQVDGKTRTINLIGASGSVQHYIDDGKGPPPGAIGALEGGRNDATLTTIPPAPGLPPIQAPPGGFGGGRAIVQPGGVIQVLPLQEVPQKRR